MFNENRAPKWLPNYVHLLDNFYISTESQHRSIKVTRESFFHALVMINPELGIMTYKTLTRETREDAMDVANWIAENQMRYKHSTNRAATEQEFFESLIADRKQPENEWLRSIIFEADHFHLNIIT
jgi:hypothetical protein